ncbi:MAG TPA: hypothetical protein VEI47_10580, partial [Gemmatimonadales bacterium]|nr:hypothetical protein [Gemmatimonadales bacterium]
MPTNDPDIAEGPARPKVALVIIARRGGEVLTTAVHAVTEVARAFAFEVLALVPAAPGGGPGPGGVSLSVRTISVDPAETEAAWRARALSETAADIVEFVDDATAAVLPWDELAPVRVGLLRMDLDPAGNLGQTLERLGVTRPARSGR